MGFAQRLRELRDAAGLTQEDLARQAGIVQSSVSRWEAGEREPSLSEAVKVARVLNTSVDSLITDVSPKPKPRRIGNRSKAKRGAAAPDNGQ